MKKSYSLLVMMVALLGACQTSAPPPPALTLTEKVDEVELGDNKLSCKAMMDEINRLKELAALSEQNKRSIQLSRANGLGNQSSGLGSSVLTSALSMIPGVGAAASSLSGAQAGAGASAAMTQSMNSMAQETYETENGARIEKRKTTLTERYNHKC